MKFSFSFFLFFLKENFEGFWLVFLKWSDISQFAEYITKLKRYFYFSKKCILCHKDKARNFPDFMDELWRFSYSNIIFSLRCLGFLPWIGFNYSFLRTYLEYFVGWKRKFQFLWIQICAIQLFYFFRENRSNLFPLLRLSHYIFAINFLKILWYGTKNTSLVIKYGFNYSEIFIKFC